MGLPAVVEKNAIIIRKRNPNRPLSVAEILNLLHSIDNIRDDALIRLGLTVGLRVSEVVSILTSNIEFERGIFKIWDEKKDLWRHIMPTFDALSAIKKYLNSLEKHPQYLLPISAKTVERIIQKRSKEALGFAISWHSVRHTYVTRSVELEQSPAVVMVNTGDSAATILKHYTKLPEVMMRRFVESKPVIPQEML